MCVGADRVQKAKMQTLRSEFEALNMKETENIDDFSLKLNNIVSNIRALRDKVEESCVVKKLLRAVSPKFLQIASTFEQFGDLDNMSVEELIGRLRAHEERIRGHVGDNGNQLLIGAHRLHEACIVLLEHYNQQNVEGCFDSVQKMQTEYFFVKNKLETLLKLHNELIAAGGSIPRQ
ncbi:histidine-containing phosphotransfer protein 1-like [Apium graveolens]|uniref:histidine-containing phosphotransfer protein 1-like n=1 Tax=Apium graveolens TaxID=4045 RepID=UPI003D795B8E